MGKKYEARVQYTTMILLTAGKRERETLRFSVVQCILILHSYKVTNILHCLNTHSTNVEMPMYILQSWHDAYNTRPFY